MCLLPKFTNWGIFMKLGAFSLSLSVKNIGKSRVFYEALGFEVFHGEEKDNWLIMKNGDTVIGLFQGMFERNMLTFNPKDVRTIQAHLKSEGVELIQEAAEGDGPTHIIMADPDGNPIMLDQHPEDYESNPQVE